MSSPLANTLLQWNVSQCLDEKLHGDLMITIPLEFQDIPSWSGSFDIHIYDEMRDSLGKVFESFLRIPTQFNLRSSPDVTSNHNPFRHCIAMLTLIEIPLKKALLFLWRLVAASWIQRV
jgi:hypothetical protein